ncbi:MAG: hypothetical protein ACREFX_15505 [Opitutaceae bacterium]
MHLPFGSAGLALAFVLASGCARTPTLPALSYPVTYRVPLGGGADGAKRVVAVERDTPLYFRVVSPVPVNAYVYDLSGPSANGALLTQLFGTNFSSSVTPDSSAMEFAFRAARPDARGTVEITLSDRPMPVPPS